MTRWHEQVLEEHPRLAKWTSSALERLFEVRLISRQVWTDRAYVPYEARAFDVVQRADPKYAAMASGRRGRVRNWINQRPGLVMQRYPIPGAPELYAQIRPFKFKELDQDFDLSAYGLEEDPGVWTGSWQHTHQPSYTHYHTPSGARFVGPRPRLGAKQTVASKDFWEWHKEKVHLGGWFEPADGEEHDHTLDWQKHLENAEFAQDHQEQDADSLHRHSDYAKYLYPPGEPAKVVDIHPLALPLIEAGGRRAFFALEGLLKNDSILSSGEPVINCGSVTLWNDMALPRFADRYLRQFETVVIVPDSDWHGNDAVSSQAHSLQVMLRSVGIKATIAAPEATCGSVCSHTGQNGLPNPDHKNGVDDWLGKGRSLDDMLVFDLQSAASVELSGGRRDRIERDRAVLQLLYERQGEQTGRIRLSQEAIATAVGRSRATVSRALRSLIDQGWIGVVPPRDDLDFSWTRTYKLHEDLRTSVARRLGDIT
jgi:hypothetical protein